MDEQQRYDSGMSKRRKVLGNAWVDKGLANRNAFNTEFQELITRYALAKSGPGRISTIVRGACS
jgi:4-carboxymuconolactone decarboxylase